MVEGLPGHKFATKMNFGDVRIQKSNILEEIQSLDKEERGQLLLEEGKKRLDLKEEFHRKLREEEIKWRQRSR